MGDTITFAATGTVTLTASPYASQTFAMPTVDATTSIQLLLTGGPLLIRFGQSSAISTGPNSFDLSPNAGAVLLLEGGVHPLAAAAAAATFIAIRGSGSLVVTRGAVGHFAH